jgi:hypothetical protein
MVLGVFFDNIALVYQIIFYFLTAYYVLDIALDIGNSDRNLTASLPQTSYLLFFTYYDFLAGKSPTN